MARQAGLVLYFPSGHSLPLLSLFVGIAILVGTCGGRGPHTPGVSEAARPRAPRFRSCGGYPPPNPGVHFWTPKSEPKKPPKPRFWIPFPNRSLSNLEHLCTELSFCHLIYNLVVDDASAAALWKGGTCFFCCVSKHGSWDAPAGVSKGIQDRSLLMRGDSKGGRAPPFVSSRKRGSTGEKPHRKGFSLRACFCLLFPRGKSRSGSGGETPRAAK